MTLDATAVSLANAKSHADAEDWEATIAAYEETLAELPKDRIPEARRIRLELAKARMENSQLPQARARTPHSPASFPKTPQPIPP